MQSLEPQLLDWLARYGYGAALPAVLSDPAGIPWAWIFLMLLAQEAGKNVTIMLLLGFGTLWTCDLVLYFIGYRWGTKLVAWLERKHPHWKETLDKARSQMQKRGALAVIIGRYLPLMGRWVGLGAGMAQVPPGKFVVYSGVGASLSAFGFGIPAHLLGREIVGNPLLMPLALGGCVVGMFGGVLFMAFSAWRSKTRGMAL
ncbi:hypothetical protein IAD21_01967 [Abditibacteriota bacterium]|nr:hypothetical protein IAD21_01967 [Abditibacteriota bacterium]